MALVLVFALAFAVPAFADVGSKVDAGFESGVSGAPLATPPWTVNGAPQQHAYDATRAKIGSKSAWIQGPTTASNAGVAEASSAGMSANGAEIRFWVYFPNTTGVHLLDDWASGVATADRADYIQFAGDGNVYVQTDKAGNPNGYTSGTFTPVGSYTAGWTQFRIVYTFSGTGAQTYTLSKRSGGGDAWTPLKAYGAAGYGIPFRGTNTIAATHGTLWRGYQGASMWLDDVLYSATGVSEIPAVPSGLAATPGTSQVGLSWTANTEADLAGYKVYRDGSALTALPITATTYTDLALAAGSYAYQVSAVDTSGNESAASPAVLSGPLATPINPGTLVDNGFESGTSGAALASPPWSLNGAPQHHAYDATKSKVGAKSAWIQGPVTASNAGVAEAASAGLSSNGAELSFWAYFDDTAGSRLLDDWASGVATTDRADFIQFGPGGTISIQTDRAGNPNGYTSGAFTPVGTYTTGWTQFKIVYTFTGTGAQTYALSKRASASDAWTPLKATGATGYAIPFRGTNTISATHGTLWRAFGNSQFWLDDLKTFATAQLTITPSAGAGGSIAPAASQTLSYGADSPTFSITPAPGFVVSDVLVDGTSVGARGTYKFSAVTADHTISATFALQAANDMVIETDCSVCHGQHHHGPDCLVCHDMTDSHPGTATSMHTPADLSACGPCHNANLTVEHAAAKTTGGADMACATCHASADTAVVSAIANNTSACASCHGTPAHTSATPKHVAAMAKCTGDGCHSGDLPTIHTTLDCADCHTTNGTAACSTCHSDRLNPDGTVKVHFYTTSAHTSGDGALGVAGVRYLEDYNANAQAGNGTYLNSPVSYSLTCTDCHSMVLDTEHAKTSSAGVAPNPVCLTCHNTAGTGEGDALKNGAWNKSCTTAGCHTLAGIHTGGIDYAHHVAPALTALPGGCSASPGTGSYGSNPYQRTPCHYQDIVQEHNRKIESGPSGTVVTTIAVTCQGCHASDAFKALNGTWDGTCDACHDGTKLSNHSVVGSAEYARVRGLHQASATFDAGYNSSQGVRITGINTMDAHGPIRTATVGSTKPIGCAQAFCHQFAYMKPGSGMYNRANVCTDCHTADTAAPTGSMSVNNSATWANTTAVTITSSMSDSQSGMGQMSVDPGTGTFGGWVAYNASYPITLPTPDGSKTVRVTFKDNAGNAVTKTCTIGLDTTAPTTTCNAVSGQTYNGNQSFSLTPTDTGSGALFSYYYLDAGSRTMGTTINVAAPSSGSVSHTIQWYSIDAAGNTQATQSVTFTVAAIVDVTPPTGSININSGATYTKTAAVTLNLSASDTGGVTQMRFSTTSASSGFGSALTYATSYAYTLPAGDGAKTVWVQYKDTAGNWSSTSIAKSITLDTVAPTTTCNAVSNQTYTGNQTFTLSPADATSGVASTFYKLDAGSFTSGTSISVTAPASGNAVSHTIQWYSTDGAGNTQATQSVTFNVGPAVVDTTPPTGTININSGATYTKVVGVTLNLSASDSGGVTQMRFSTTSASSGFGSALTYATSYSYNLPTPDGAKTVWVQYKDTAGNWSSTAISKSITLDTAAPTTGSNVVAGQTYNGNQTFTLSPADATSGIASNWYKLDSGAWTSGTSIAVIAPATGTVSHTIQWYSIDNAGNTQTTQSRTFTMAPTASTTTLAMDFDGGDHYDIEYWIYDETAGGGALFYDYTWEEHSFSVTHAVTAGHQYRIDLVWYDYETDESGSDSYTVPAAQAVAGQTVTWDYTGMP
jgi:hypothetical protein